MVEKIKSTNWEKESITMTEQGFYLQDNQWVRN